MHITCVICSDLFSPSADIYSTQCGHIFHYTCLLHWLENSKTCPQCRNKVSSKSLVRLFVNVAQSHDLGEDVTLLQHKLDSMEFATKVKEKEIRNVANKNKECEAQNKALREQIKQLELSDRRYESIVAALKEQVKYFKEQSQNCNRLQEEVSRLKNELKNLEHVQTAICASRQQVDEIIQNESNVDSLALLAATLKKTLVETERKKVKFQQDFKKSQHELSQCKRKMLEMKCEEDETKKQLASLKLNYEREVKYLKDKFSQLKSKEPFRSDSLNNSLQLIAAESPVNYNRKVNHSEKSDSIVDLSESFTPPRSDRSPHTPPLEVLHKPLLLETNDDTIDESPLPASSMAIFGLQRAKSAGHANSSNKFSIFKHKQFPPSESVPSTSSSIKRPDVSYNGLGGSCKEDVFPSSSGIKRPKTVKSSGSKFKKLSADAGKSSKKMSDFFIDLS